MSVSVPVMPTGVALLVSAHRTAREKPPDAAIAMHHPVLDLIDRSPARDVRPGLFDNGCRIIGMHQSAPVVQMVADFVILVAQHFLEHRIHVDFTGGEIPIPDTDDAAGRGRPPVPVVDVHGCLHVFQRDGVGDGRQQFDIVERLRHRRCIHRANGVRGRRIGIAADQNYRCRGRFAA